MEIASQKQELLNGNTAMYLYLGYYVDDDGEQLNHPTGASYVRQETLEALPDWNTLMQAVTKISLHIIEQDKTGTYRAFPRTFGMRNEETGMMMVRFNMCPLFEARTLLEATWLAVVDFCKDEIQKDQYDSK